tara:strand:+ start:133 stop:1614 length:1482 start_codon:yes stop_codon:yes gene_type:complete
MSIFGNFNNKFGQFGMPANLGLLTTGIGLLDGQNPLQAIQAGIGTYGSFQDMEEDRRRKAALLKLTEQYGNDPRMQQLINANPEAAVGLIANLEMQKRKPTAKFRNLTSDELAARGFPEGTVAQINDTSGQVNVLTKPTAKAKPTLKEFDGDLYKVTDGKLDLLKEGDDENKFITLGNKVYRQDGENLVEVIDDSQPKFKEFDGDLYKVTKDGLSLAQKGDDKNKFITLNDKIYRQEGENLVEVIDDPQTKSASLVNLISRTDVTVDGVTYPANQRFAFDKNSEQALIKEARSQGAFVAPQKIEEVKAPTVDTSEVDKVVKELEDTTKNTSLNVDVGTAAGGDIPGVVTDLANTVFGAFTGTFSPNRADQVALINEANNTIKVPLVKALNRAGSKFAIEQVDSILPLPNNTNQTFMSRFEALKPRLDIAIKQLAAESVDTEKSEGERIIAKEEARQLINYKANMERAIAVYRKNTGGSKTAAQTAADKILGVD